MRRVEFVLGSTLCALLAMSATSDAQFQRRVRPVPRAWIVISDGFGPSGGGVSNTTGLSQLIRASATVSFTQTLGMELSALRIQELIPSMKLINDRALNDPRADGLFAGIAQLSGDSPRGGFPSVATLGGGVVRRPTNDPAKTRLTGALQIGVESSLWRPRVSWADATAGLRALLMPVGNKRELYLLALTVGIRVG